MTFYCECLDIMKNIRENVIFTLNAGTKCVGYDVLFIPSKSDVSVINVLDQGHSSHCRHV